MKTQGPRYVLSERTERPEHHWEDEQPLVMASAPGSVLSWNGESQRTRPTQSSSIEKTNPVTKSTDGKEIATSPYYSAPLTPASTPYNEKETKNPSEERDKTPKAPSCTVNVTGGSFQRPVEINLTCSTASTIKYCIGENNCCDPDQGNIYSGAFQLGQASKSFCISFSGTSNDDQLTSETKEAFYTFDSELPHLEVILDKTHVQTTQLDTGMILRSNDFGSNHHTLGVINLKSHNPSESYMDCPDIVKNHASLSLPIPQSILPETSVSTFSPSNQMNLFLTGNGLTYGENYLTAYVKSMLYSFPQYSCSNTNLMLEDFNYAQPLPMDVLSGSDNSELYGGFIPLSTIKEDGTYRGPANELGASPNQELRTGIISILFDK